MLFPASDPNGVRADDVARCRRPVHGQRCRGVSQSDGHVRPARLLQQQPEEQRQRAAKGCARTRVRRRGRGAARMTPEATKQPAAFHHQRTEGLQQQRNQRRKKRPRPLKFGLCVWPSICFLCLRAAAVCAQHCLQIEGSDTAGCVPDGDEQKNATRAQRLGLGGGGRGRRHRGRGAAARGAARCSAGRGRRNSDESGEEPRRKENTTTRGEAQRNGNGPQRQGSAVQCSGCVSTVRHTCRQPMAVRVRSWFCVLLLCRGPDVWLSPWRWRR